MDTWTIVSRDKFGVVRYEVYNAEWERDERAYSYYRDKDLYPDLSLHDWSQYGGTVLGGFSAGRGSDDLEKLAWERWGGK